MTRQFRPESFPDFNLTPNTSYLNFGSTTRSEIEQCPESAEMNRLTCDRSDMIIDHAS